MSAAGVPMVQPEDADIDRLIVQVRASGVRAVAVAFLHSYRNPAHETHVAARITDALPDVFVTCSSELGRQWREYERFTTATANAYVAPLIRNYTSRLIEDLGAGGFGGDTLFLDAGGGAVGRGTIERFPIRLVESGPVGGVIAAARIAHEIGLINVVTLDIGGTTAKSSLIEEGAFETLSEYWIGGHDRGLPLQIPVVDIEEVGAGGGSLAWLDDGRLRVGPRSAGAVPGPAAYGRGGQEPTITDALVHCGLFHPSLFLAEIHLDAAAATQAIERLAVRCRLSTDRLALGMLQLATETTAGVVRRQTMERGLDPASFTMIVSGGAGPGQACAVADAVGIKRVLIPPFPGHFSAYGMLQSDLRFTKQELVEVPLPSLSLPSFLSLIERLRCEVEHIVARDSRFAGSTSSEVTMALRYAGQDHSLRLPLATGMLESGAGFHEAVTSDFARRYERRYGYVDDSSGIEVIDVEVVVQKDLPPVRFAAAVDKDVPPPRTVSCLFDESSGFVAVSALHRTSLRPGRVLAGPLLIYEIGSITVVPPRWTVERMKEDQLALTRQVTQ